MAALISHFFKAVMTNVFLMSEQSDNRASVKAAQDVLTSGFDAFLDMKSDIDQRLELITVNAVAIDTNSIGVTTNATNILTNVANIASNKTNNNLNSSRITTNSSDIANNLAGITTNGNKIETNDDGISSNTTNVASNSGLIATNSSGITTNVASIATNVTGIATNVTGIANNVTNIANNVANIASNKANIDTNSSGITTNSGLIATNTTDINDNSTTIALNDGDRRADITTNSAGITTNTNDIEANVTAISSSNTAINDIAFRTGNITRQSYDPNATRFSSKIQITGPATQLGNDLTTWQVVAGSGTVTYDALGGPDNNGASTITSGGSAIFIRLNNVCQADGTHTLTALVRLTSPGGGQVRFDLGDAPSKGLISGTTSTDWVVARVDAESPSDTAHLDLAVYGSTVVEIADIRIAYQASITTNSDESIETSSGATVNGGLTVGSINTYTPVGGKFSMMNDTADILVANGETSLINTSGAIGTLLFQPSELVAGASYHVKFGGTFSTPTNKEEAALVIRLGTNSILDTGFVEYGDLGGDVYAFEIEVDIVVRGGASAQVYVNANIAYVKNDGENGFRGRCHQQLSSIDSSTALALSATWAWATGVNAACAIKNRMCYISRVY